MKISPLSCSFIFFHILLYFKKHEKNILYIYYEHKLLYYKPDIKCLYYGRHYSDMGALSFLCLVKNWCWVWLASSTQQHWVWLHRQIQKDWINKKIDAIIASWRTLSFLCLVKKLMLGLAAQPNPRRLGQ